MAALNRLELITEAANNVGRKLTTTAADGTTTLKTRLIRALNAYVQPWCARAVTKDTEDGFYFNELNRTADMNTVADQKSYTWPQDLREIHSLTLIDGSNSWKLTRLSRRRMEQLFPNPASWPSSNRPQWYTSFGKGFELIPVPNQVYSLRGRYSIWPASMDADAQVSDLTNKDDLLIARLTGEAYSFLQEYESDAKEWFAKSENLLKDAIKADPREWDWAPAMAEFSASQSEPHREYWKDPLMGHSGETW